MGDNKMTFTDRLDSTRCIIDALRGIEVTHHNFTDVISYEVNESRVIIRVSHLWFEDACEQLRSIGFDVIPVCTVFAVVSDSEQSLCTLQAC